MSLNVAVVDVHVSLFLHVVDVAVVLGGAAAPWEIGHPERNSLSVSVGGDVRNLSPQPSLPLSSKMNEHAQKLTSILPADNSPKNINIPKNVLFFTSILESILDRKWANLGLKCIQIPVFVVWYSEVVPYPSGHQELNVSIHRSLNL